MADSIIMGKRKVINALWLNLGGPFDVVDFYRLRQEESTKKPGFFPFRHLMCNFERSIIFLQIFQLNNIRKKSELIREEGENENEQ